MHAYHPANALSSRTGVLVQRVLLTTPEASLLDGCAAPHHALVLCAQPDHVEHLLEELLTLAPTELASRVWVGPTESARAMTDALSPLLAHAWAQPVETEELADLAVDACLLGRWDLSYGVSLVIALHPDTPDYRLQVLNEPMEDMVPVAYADVMNTPEEIYWQMQAVGLSASTAQAILDEVLLPEVAGRLWARLEGVAFNPTARVTH